MKKVAVVVGHTKLKQGAVSPFTDTLPSEWKFNSAIAEGLRSPEIDIYYYDPNAGDYIDRVNELASRINQQDYEAVIELHYNASELPQANGTEALHYLGSEKGKEVAFLFCQLFTHMFKTKNRFEKALYHRKQRGFYFLKKMKAPAIILEPIFGTSQEDIDLFCGSSDSYEEFLRDLITNYILK